MKFDRTKQSVMAMLAEKFDAVDYIKAALVYGSWLYDARTSDVDIAIMIDSEGGVVAPCIYQELRAIRHELCRRTCQDIDLIPHTEDELDSFNTPIWYPKTNPALCSGYRLKGQLDVRPFSLVNCFFRGEDIAAYQLHDNRTVCRRQFLRNVDGEAGRIFVSKMLHGPANALTHIACRRHQRYLASPSNLQENLAMFDLVFEVDTSPARPFLMGCKEQFNYDKALKLLNWYEHLQAMVLYGHSAIKRYQDYCQALEYEPVRRQPEMVFAGIPELVAVSIH